MAEIAEPPVQVFSSSEIPISPTPKPNKYRSMIVAFALLLIIVGIAFGSIALAHKQLVSIANTIAHPTVIPIPTGTPVPTPTPIIIPTGVIDWLAQPEKVDSVGFFTKMDTYYPYKLMYCQSGTDCSKTLYATDIYEPKATYYRVGTMKSKYPGSPVYLAIVKGLLTSHVFKGIGTEKDFAHDYTTEALFIKTGENTFVLTGDYNNRYLLCNVGCNTDEPTVIEGSGIRYDGTVWLDVVGTKNEFNDMLSGTKMFVNKTLNFFVESGSYLIKDFGNGYKLYSNENFNSNPIKLKTIINTTFTIRLPTGLSADVNGGPYLDGFLYKKDPDPNAYFPYSDAAQLTWTAGVAPTLLPDPISTPSSGIMKAKSVSYSPDYDGCYGNLTIDNVASDSEFLDIQHDLTPVAKTDKGDIFYDLNQKDFKIFQQLYFWKVQNSGTYNLTYEEYLKVRPILVWKNTLGVYRMVFRAELVGSKCWAEPLIYLYPTKKTEVQISLDKIITLKESEPPYHSGWSLTAYPDGKIYSQTKDRYYPYLYWEGSAPVGDNPVASSVVAQKDVHAFFETSLAKLGLNAKEIKDFEGYWEPKLAGSPYYLISLYDAASLNAKVPLHILPKPDTEIRVLMTYSRLNRSISIPSSNLDSYTTPNRTGFTVVEWGGILHK